MNTSESDDARNLGSVTFAEGGELSILSRVPPDGNVRDAMQRGRRRRRRRIALAIQTVSCWLWMQCVYTFLFVLIP